MMTPVQYARLSLRISRYGPKAPIKKQQQTLSGYDKAWEMTQREGAHAVHMVGPDSIPSTSYFSTPAPPKTIQH